jgi:PAS domain S-box-containing protein
VQFWPAVAYDLLCLNSDWLWEVNTDGILSEWTQGSLARQRQKALPLDRREWRYYLRDDREFRVGVAELLRKVKQREPIRCVRLSCWLPHARVRGWLRLSGHPFYDNNGNFLGYRGAAMNITGQVMTERKMQRLERHNMNLLAAIDASPSIVFMADLTRPHWPIVYANPTFTNLTGYSHEQVMGKNALFLAGPATEAKELGRLREAVEFRSQAVGRLQLHKRDGSAFWAAVSLVPGCQEQGRCMVVGLIRDITAEMAYEQANEQRGRLEALGRLAGGMAHEINNLLQPSQLNAEIIGEDLGPAAPQQPFIEDIKTSLAQISFIVKNTLQFARKNEEHKSLPRASMAQLLAQRLDYLRTVLPATLALERAGLETAGDVRINHTEFAQVLTNLATNAAHAMSNKGTLSVRLTRRRLDGVREASLGLPLGEYFILTVSDTGHGMSEAVQARIFEPFFTTKAVGEGTGLGLSVVYGLVVGWGGRISVTSAPGQGTTFTLLIPVAAAIVAEGECHEQEGIAGGRHGRHPPLGGTSAAAGGL